MGFIGRWELDDLLTFPANTHAAATGAATDADSAPSYRIYEDETGTPILTGTMSKLDDTNTTGFYSEQITLSAANGFEVGKSYTIYISATVSSVTGTMAHTFQVEAALATASALATVQADTDDIQSRLPAALVSGRMDASVGAMAANVLTATAIASDAITAAKIADGAIDAATFATGAITAAAIAADAIGASELAADAVAEIQSGLATASALTTVDTNVDTLVSSIVTLDDVAAALLEEPVASHSSVSGSVAESMAAVQTVTDALTAASAAKLAASAGTIIVGTAITGTLSTTQMTTNLTEATDDHYVGRIVIFTSGALAGQAAEITDYVGSTKLITMTTLTEAPSNGTAFVIV